MAALCVVLAHAGTSTNWVFSATLLQIHTEDRFRGRAFSADYALCMLTISASSYLAGALDLGVALATFAIYLGSPCSCRRHSGLWPCGPRVNAPGPRRPTRGVYAN